jgi:copper chaperone CopZ
MKWILYFLGTLLFINTANAQIKKVDIVATGLTCSMCSNAIYKQLQSINGVEKVEIDLNKNLFMVILKNENTLTPKDFKDKVEGAGFFVGSMLLHISYLNLPIEDGKQESNYVFIDTKAQTLNGDKQFRVLDKGYVTSKEFKKNSKAYTKYSTYATTNENDYHIKLVQ